MTRSYLGMTYSPLNAGCGFANLRVSHGNEDGERAKYLDLKLLVAFLCQNKGSKSRLVKSHDFVMSLTILGPVSHSHELATDFSRFLEKSNSKQFWICRVVSKLDINRKPAQLKENGNRM